MRKSRMMMVAVNQRVHAWIHPFKLSENFTVSVCEKELKSIDEQVVVEVWLVGAVVVVVGVEVVVRIKADVVSSCRKRKKT